MAYVIAPPTPPSVAVVGTEDRFPVRRVYGIGKNYAAHVREMGGSVETDPPVVFTKPGDSVVETSQVRYPLATTDLHHEVELVVAIAVGGEQIAEAAALNHVFGYAVGVDLTRRDFQHRARSRGEPWDMAKGFDQAAPCGPITPASQCGHLSTGPIRLRVNGKLRQDGDLSDLILSVPSIIAYLSTMVSLMPGDLIFTGTPEGVAPLNRGDTVVAEIVRLSSLTFTIID